VFEPERKKELLNRLHRIGGQVKGIAGMVEEDAGCVEVLTQVSSVFEALRGVSKLVMRNYLETCVTRAIRSEEPGEAEAVYGNLMDVIYKFAK